MSISNAIVGRLKSVATVNDLVEGRIEPVIGTDDAGPSVVYRSASKQKDRTFGGHSKLVSYTVRVACVAPTYALCDQLAGAVEDAMDNQEGRWGGVDVQGAFMEDGDGDDAIGVDEGADVRRYVKDLEFLIWTSE